MEAVRAVQRRKTQGALVKRKTVATVPEDAVTPAPQASAAASTVVRRKGGKPGRAPIRTATVPETKGDLRETFPRYAAAFDQVSSDGGSTVSLPEAFRALFQILDDSSADRPWEQIEEFFNLQDSQGKGRIDFYEFCNVVRDVKTAIAIKEEEEAAKAPEAEESAEEEEDDDAVELKDGKVFFKSKAKPSAQEAEEAPPVRRRPGKAKTVAMTRSLSEIGAFALRTTVLPPLHRDEFRGYKLTEWKIIRKSWGNYGSGCGRLEFSADGQQLAASFLDGTSDVYEVKSMDSDSHPGSRILSKESWESVMADAAASVASGTKKSFGRAGATITNMRWSHEGAPRNMLASVDAMGFLQLWEIPQAHEKQPPKMVENVKVGLGTPLGALAFSCDASRIYAAGSDRKVHCFDVENMSSISAVQAQELGEESLVTLQGKSLEDLKHVAGHSQKVMSLRVHPLMPDVVFSAGMDSQVLLWDLRKGNTKPVTAAESCLMRADCMDISADGNTLLTGSYEQGQAIQLHDVRMKGELPKRPLASYSWNGDEDPLGHGRYCTQTHILSTGWDAKNKLLFAAGEKDHLARLFAIPKAGSRKPLHVIATLESSYPFLSMAISRDGGSVAVGGLDGTVQLARLHYVDPRRDGK
eukprot:gb/GFBE01042356.1/.p1 GENE.gb/GFBE01042356.1/~~gb/GFBE01042356.1/.p1  ORF type:complete len:639 (+),score=120.41 gb/GFBE01042356.1/:1-1917(+)